MEIFLQTVISGLLMGLVFALIAMGLAVIFGVMDIVNFAHGDFMMVGMYVAFLTSSLLSIDPVFAIPVSALVGVLLGLASYYLLVRHLLRGPMVAQMLGTFGLSIFLTYFAMAIFGPNYKSLQHGILIGKSVEIGAIILPYSRLGTGVISLIVFSAIYWLINHTRLGKALQATALNAEAAGYMGIETGKMRAIAWAVGGGTVGVAGALMVNFYYVFPTVGILFVLIAFTTVALGGFGSIKGAFIAGLMIGVIVELGGTYISSQHKFAIIYLVYFMVMIFRPKGLFGYR